MPVAEVLAGWGTFATLFVGSVTFGAYSGSTTVHAFSFLAGIGAGGAMGVFAALAVHLARRRPGPVWTEEDPIFPFGDPWAK